jgi:cell division protein FtsB
MNPKVVSTVISVLTALGAVWARFIVVEQRQENQLAAITQLRQDMTQIEARVSSLERDRQMLERVHALELRLTTIEEHAKERVRR